MAYYNNIPNLYPSAVPYGNNQMNNGITWVQGEQAAKAYPVAVENVSPSGADAPAPAINVQNANLTVVRTA